MTRKEIESEVCRIISVILKKEVGPGENIERKKVSDWNSLKHLEIIFSIEDKFGIEFKEEEFPKLTGSAAIAVLVAEHLDA